MNRSMTTRPSRTLIDSRLADVVRSEAALRRYLQGLPGVDQVGAEERARSLADPLDQGGHRRCGRSRRAISMVDLTTLEGADTPGKVASLCEKARQSRPRRRRRPAGRRGLRLSRPRRRGETRARRLGRRRRRGRHRPFPSGRGVDRGEARRRRRRARSREPTRSTWSSIAAPFSTGRYAAGARRGPRGEGGLRTVHLKVILETGELATYDNVRRASWIAMFGGADFIKTSTGKIVPAATLPVASRHARGGPRLRRR